MIQRLDFHHLWYRFQLFRFSCHTMPYVWSHDLVFTLLLSPFRLFPFRSPLLWESLLLSFPLATKMFQFTKLSFSSL